ncbi:MAG: peptidyl-tRNA hydrolase [Candidatus Lokiarchaeota archaeon]|nr:peptidyl-tRNA hydrolase [Candidatus Lokiarchaeota archaeon]
MKNFEFKQVILIRTDIKMGKGKLAVQVAHAAVSNSEVARKNSNYQSYWQKWIREGQKKVVIKASSLDILLKFQDLANKNGYPNALIQDAGLTQIPPGTKTALAIGPITDDQATKLGLDDLPLL